MQHMGPRAVVDRMASVEILKCLLYMLSRCSRSALVPQNTLRSLSAKGQSDASTI